MNKLTLTLLVTALAAVALLAARPWSTSEEATPAENYQRLCVDYPAEQGWDMDNEALDLCASQFGYQR